MLESCFWAFSEHFLAPSVELREELLEVDDIEPLDRLSDQLQAFVLVVVSVVVDGGWPEG